MTEEAKLEPLGTVDQMLQYYVDRTNEGKMNIGVTLLVGGMFVTGNTVSADAFVNHHFEQYINRLVVNVVNPEPGVEINQEEFRRGMREGLEERAKEVQEQPVATQPARFIHLKNVQVNAPIGPQLQLHQDSWWRVRLDKVDGWVLGELVEP